MTNQSRVQLRVPFSEFWGMRIEHPYSMLVRADGLAWTCGQCPLAQDGSVLAPDDLGRQADYVEDYIERLLQKAGFSPNNVGKLVLYHAPTDPADTARLLERFRIAFPSALLIPVGTPFFYYPGMRLEVDAHAAERCAPIIDTHDDLYGLRIEAVDAGELIWVTLKVLADPQPPGAAGLNSDAVRDALRASVGVSPSALLADHWFVCGPSAVPALERLREARLVTDPGVAVGVTLPDDFIAMGELTFAPGGRAGTSFAMSSQAETSVFVRKSRNHFWITARSVSPDLSLVGQTKAIMTSVAETMSARGWPFEAVCKATTHYVGSSTAEDLHENMSVRNAYYRRPGPASTGLPVASFPFSSSKIAVDLLGVIE